MEKRLEGIEVGRRKRGSEGGSAKLRCAGACVRLTQIEAEDWTHSVSGGRGRRSCGAGRAGTWAAHPGRRRPVQPIGSPSTAPPNPAPPSLPPSLQYKNPLKLVNVLWHVFVSACICACLRRKGARRRDEVTEPRREREREKKGRKEGDEGFD